MKGFVEDFKEFIARGNIVDMAIGVIIGGAFGKIVSSLVEDIMMPVLGLLMGGLDLTQAFVALDGNEYGSLAQAQEAGAAVLNYGAFIQSLIDFLIIALVIFFALRQMTRLMDHFRKEEEEAPKTKTCPHCKSDIHIEATRCPSCTSDLAEGLEA